MKSMTGYAARDADGRRWDIRSVNARGFDLRLRMPDLPPGLERAIREAVGKVAARGNVTLSLRLGTTDMGGPSLSDADLHHALDALGAVQTAAADRGVTLSATSAADILAIRGVWEARDIAPEASASDLTADLTALLADFDADRSREGMALKAVVTAQVDEIEALTQAATDLLPARREQTADSFTAALTRLTAKEPRAEIDPARVAQEVAALLVKSDVAEELDRLTTHIAAARSLLDTDGPVGRRLDFLTQEFNREANTLCSKAGMAELTAIGLDLKAVIDRLREQVQNLE